MLIRLDSTLGVLSFFTGFLRLWLRFPTEAFLSNLELRSIVTGLLRLWLGVLTLAELSTLILWPILERLDVLVSTEILLEFPPLPRPLLLETLLVIPDAGEEIRTLLLPEDVLGATLT